MKKLIVATTAAAVLSTTSVYADSTNNPSASPNSVQSSPMNPCNGNTPCSASAAPVGCNPCAATMPCNPCNPCAASNPCAAGTGCNPCASAGSNSDSN